MSLLAKWRHVFTQELGWDSFTTTLRRGDVDLHGVGEKRGIGAYYVEPDAVMAEALRSGPDETPASLLAFTDLLFEKPPATKNNAKVAMRLAIAMMAGMPNSTEMEQVYAGMALHPDSYSLYTFLDPICRLTHARSAVGAP